MMTNDVQWELGYESPVDPGYEEQFGYESYTEDLNAINVYVTTTMKNKATALLAAGKISKSKYDKWLELQKDWMGWYERTIKSWYISDEDAAFARKKRDDINMLLQPEATKTVQSWGSPKKIAATPEEYRKMEAAEKTFLQNHWLGLTLLGVAGVTAAYLSGNVLAFLKIAGRASGAKHAAKLLGH